MAQKTAFIYLKKLHISCQTYN